MLSFRPLALALASLWASGAQPWRRIVSLVGAMSLAAAAQGADLDPSEVKHSIERAVTFLKREQRAGGDWPAFVSYDPTALCALALLNAGVEPSDPAIQKALKYLRSPDHQPNTTYQVALRTMVFAAAEPKKDLLLIRNHVKLLEGFQIKEGGTKGGWSYPGRDGDNSNSQFALLALHEAERVGVPVREEIWRKALEYWEDQQNVDGSWSYKRGTNPSGSMTCAGICSLIIAHGRLTEGDATEVGGQVRCCGQQGDNQRIEDGLAWLARNFSVDTNPGEGNWVLYYLYALERTGRLSGRRFIGDHDWYREGTAKLIKEQDTLGGSWQGAGPVENNEHIATSFALLFLAKGRRPILMAKLKHGPDEDWNRHRSDAGNLTKHIETLWKRDLSWQTVVLEEAPVEDLQQSPVLYLSGENAPQIDDAQAQRLRKYLERGGFLLAEACCDGGAKFDAGFRELVRRIFPEKEYQLRLLEPDHPVWFAERPIDPALARPLWGVDFGCRTSVVYIPPEPLNMPRPSLSCLWELANPDHDTRIAPEVRAQIDAALGIGANILAYATNREVKFKYELFSRQKAAEDDPHDRGLLHIAKLRHAGGWNAAPGALLALQEAMIREQHARVSLRQHEVTLTDDAVFQYHLIFLHGRNDFRFSPQERERLRTYLERGGMILADAVCASDQFAAAFRREMASVLPDHPLERIPVDHPLLTPHYGGFDLRQVDRRDPGRNVQGGVQAPIRRGEPHLEGVLLQQRYAVVFSPFDLSCALESQGGIQCRGYTREDAARIGVNVIMYSLQE